MRVRGVMSIMEVGEGGKVKWGLSEGEERVNIKGEGEEGRTGGRFEGKGK